MAENSSIEWTDHTFNPWIGCTKVSPGCDGCYAEALMDKRYHRVYWGAGMERKRTSVSNWKLPLKWDKAAAAAGRRDRVFCASLADVFDNEVPPQWRGELWALIRRTPNLDWLLLTKRIGNVRGMLPADWERGYSNVWLGATVVNQEEADRDIPKLLAVPAAKRFLSMEPLLGPVDLSRILLHSGPFEPAEDAPPAWKKIHTVNVTMDSLRPGKKSGRPALDWVICGGESGPKARPMHPDWARSLRDQCNAAGVSFFFKQWGEWGVFLAPPVGDSFRWPNRDDGTNAWSYRVGKQRAGRLLDGREWNEVPCATT